MSARTLSERAGISRSHLSRLETGKRESISRETLDDIAEVLTREIGDAEPQCRDELFGLAGMLRPTVERQLATVDYSLAFAGETLSPETHRRLRRLHLAQVADRELKAAGYPGRGVVEPVLLLGSRGIALRRGDDDAKPVVFVDGVAVEVTERDPDRPRRFLAVHAAAHLFLGVDPAVAVCQFGRSNEVEEEAMALTSLLMIPRTALRGLVLSAAMSSRDMWDSTTFLRFVLRVAGAFDVPLWLAVRRLAEDGHLGRGAGVDEV